MPGTGSSWLDLLDTTVHVEIAHLVGGGGGGGGGRLEMGMGMGRGTFEHSPLEQHSTGSWPEPQYLNMTCMAVLMSH